MMILSLKSSADGASIFKLNCSWSGCDIRVRYGSDQVIRKLMFLVCVQIFIWSIVDMLHYFVTLGKCFLLDTNEFLIVGILASLECWLGKALFLT